MAAIILESQLQESLKKAINRANDTNSSILFSKVIKTQQINPLSFYQIGREHYAGERLYWKDSDDQTIIVGLGRIEKIQTDIVAERFESIEKQWEEIVDRSIVHADTIESATGPIMFGGFSFDSNKSSSLLWAHFGDNFFYVPQYILTVRNNCTYLTINIWCSPNSDIATCMKKLQHDEVLMDQSKEKHLHNVNVCKSIQEIEPDIWKKTVADAVSTIKETAINKIVLARELRLTFENNIESEVVLQRLLEEQPTSFIYSLEVGSNCFVGASPERLVKKEKNHILSTCLAGSIARGKTKEEDDSLGKQLLHDPKNLMEHQFVVSMIQEALQTECNAVSVPNTPNLMKIKHIQHLYTPVTAECDKQLSILRLVEKLHPTPALGGLPQKEAVKWIAEHESLERGFYAAPIGWIDVYGNGEFAVGIRCALLQGKEASLFAGCGIVKDSTPEAEYEETWIKFQPMLNALGGVGS